MSAKRMQTSSSKKTPAEGADVKKSFASSLSSPDHELTPARRSGRQAERLFTKSARDEELHTPAGGRASKQKATEGQHEEATPAKKGRTELQTKPKVAKSTPRPKSRKAIPPKKAKSPKKRLIVKLDKTTPKAIRVSKLSTNATVGQSRGDVTKLSDSPVTPQMGKEAGNVVTESKLKGTETVTSSKVIVSPMSTTTKPKFVKTTNAKVASVEVIRVSPSKAGSSQLTVVRSVPATAVSGIPQVSKKGSIPEAIASLSPPITQTSGKIPASPTTGQKMVTGTSSVQLQQAKNKLEGSPKSPMAAKQTENPLVKSIGTASQRKSGPEIMEIEQGHSTPTLRQSSRTKLFREPVQTSTPEAIVKSGGKHAGGQVRSEEPLKISPREPSARIAKKKSSDINSHMPGLAQSDSQIEAAVASISSDEVMDSPPVLRRKRVASELLKAAEIAHCMLDEGGSELNPVTGQFVSKATRSSTSSRKGKSPRHGEDNESNPDGWVSILRSPSDNDTAPKKVSVGLTADLDSDVEISKPTPPPVRANGRGGRPVSKPMPAKSGFNMATEKSNDRIFDGVTAIIKSSLIDNDQAKDFVLNKLPALTGVSAVVSPSNHYLLHGSWKSILRARESLDRYLSALAALTSEITLKKLTSKNQRNGSPEPSADVLGIKKDRHLPVDPEISAQVASQVQIGASDWQDTDDAFDDDDDDDVENSIDLDMTPKEDPEVILKVAKTKGLDRTKLSSNVEVYKDSSQGSTYLCSMCGFASNQKYNVTAHIHKKHAERKYKCLLCSKAFAYNAELERHVRTIHVSGEKYTCNICDKQFTDKRYLSTHLKRHSGVRNHQCPICDRKFFERHKLRWHLETHKDAAEKNLPYSCSVCHRKFYNRSSLADHQNIHTGARPFECHMCDSSFSHRIGLKRHLLVHSDDRPFPCQICEKTFKTKKQLEVHGIQHTGKSKYMCQSCNRPFATLNSLKRHLLICMKDESRHASNLIEEVVIPEQVVGQSVEETSAPEADQEEETIYMCGVCDQVFPTLEVAATHTRTHTSDVQVQYQNAAENAGEAYVFAMPDASMTNDDSSSYVCITNSDGTPTEETAVKLLNAMTSGQDYIVQEAPTSPMDDTHIVANTLADLSAFGQSQI